MLCFASFFPTWSHNYWKKNILTHPLNSTCLFSVLVNTCLSLLWQTEYEGAHGERPELPLQVWSHISRDDAAEISFSRLSDGNLWVIQVNEINHPGVNWTHSESKMMCFFEELLHSFNHGRLFTDRWLFQIHMCFVVAALPGHLRRLIWTWFSSSQDIWWSPLMKSFAHSTPGQVCQQICAHWMLLFHRCCQDLPKQWRWKTGCLRKNVMRSGPWSIIRAAFGPRCLTSSPQHQWI